MFYMISIPNEYKHFLRMTQTNGLYSTEAFVETPRAGLEVVKCKVER